MPDKHKRDYAHHRREDDVEVTEFDDIINVGWTFLLKLAVSYIELLAHKSFPIKPPAAVELIIRTRLGADW